MFKKKTWKIITSFILFFSLTFGVVKTAMAYQTDINEPILNPFTIALDSTSTVVEKYPDPTPKPGTDNSISYEKAAQVGNTGYIDCYVRLRLDFTEDDIKNKSQFSSDGNTWYSVADYSNHLPSGWVYNNSDGYYYYTGIVYAENWEETSKNFNYDKGLGEYFYKSANQQIVSASCMTTPLMRYVKTIFDSPADMRSYNLNVYSESVPYYFGNDYSQAWQNYLND